MDDASTATRGRRGWNAGALTLLSFYAIGVLALAAAARLTFPGPPAEPLPTALSVLADPSSWLPSVVLLAVGAVGFVLYAWPRQHDARPFSFYLTAGTGLSTLVLSTAASWECGGGEAPLFTALGTAAGLLVGNAPAFDGACATGWPPALQLAAVLGPAGVVLAAVGIAAALFRSQLDRLGVRYAARLVVVVGLDGEAVPLLRRLGQETRRRGRRPVLAVLLEDAGNPLIRRARTLGARVVVVQQRAALRHLLIRRRRFKVDAVQLVGSDVTANLDWARTFREVADASRTVSSDAPPRMTARIDDPWQAEFWRRTNAYRTPTDGRVDAVRWVSDAVSVHEVTAAILVQRVQDQGFDRLVLVGAAPLALAICAELAQRRREDSVLRTDSRPSFDHLELVGPHAGSLLAQHQLRQERFGNNADVEKIRIHDAPATAELLAALLDGVARPALIVTDRRALDAPSGTSASLLAARHPSWTIFEPDPLADGVADRPVMHELYPYGLTLEPPAGVSVDSWQRAGRVVHQRYVSQLASPDPAKPTHRPWEDLPEFYRQSNVRLVTTTLSAAESVGRSWGPLVAGDDRSSVTVPVQQLTAMARREHESWRRFCSDNGWRRGPRDDSRRRHPALVPWEDLSAEFREQTVETVRSALSTLNALGYRSSTAADRPWTAYRRFGEVTAEVVDQAWSWSTANGDVLQAQPGDVRVTGSDGRTWSVDPAIFARTYEQLGPGRYRRVGVVQAQPAVPGELVLSMEGPETAGEDDWLIRGSAGELWLTSQAHFAANYRPA